MRLSLRQRLGSSWSSRKGFWRWGYKSKVGMEDANWRRLLKCGCNLIHHHHSTQKTIVCATGLIIWLFENEIESAEKYAEIARESDSYNPAAFVNLGNCHFQRGDVEKAKVCNHTKWSVCKESAKKYFSIYIVDFYPSAAPCAFADGDEDFVLGVVHGGAGQWRLLCRGKISLICLVHLCKIVTFVSRYDLYFCK